MDHKKFFDTWENRKIADQFGFSQVSYEQLYQAIKQRLIAELRTDLKSESCMAVLTDISEQKDG